LPRLLGEGAGMNAPRTIRKCRRCHEDKPLEDYKSGHRTCVECVVARQVRRNNNKERPKYRRMADPPIINLCPMESVDARIRAIREGIKL
jgi:hypothetical protein